MDKEIKNYFIAYFDILGYENMVKNDNKKLLEMISQVIELSESVKAAIEEQSAAFNMKVFSDNFLFCTENEYTGLSVFVSALQAILTTNNIFVKGALCYGEMCYDEKFVYGKGLIDIYKLESEVAIFPRIILDSSYISAAAKIETQTLGTTVTFNKMKEHLPFHQTDFDNNIYLDYLVALEDLAKYSKNITKDNNHSFDVYLKMHQDNIKENLKTKDRRILQKYEWCKTYHNKFCNENNYENFLIK